LQFLFSTHYALSYPITQCFVLASHVLLQLILILL